ncbi:hypothetical protein IPL68_03790 [Candidatus Saccharibacteria bacterium]|nr:MAG: hypothetical protein IPL68_03790 [Candidatus Saccharibacteria bacterium]
MVQFNLLPDIKLEFVKARRMKYLMSFVSFIVGGAAITALLFAFFFVNVIQKKSLNDLQSDIKTYSNDLKNTKNLDKILTVQNQLGALTSVNNKPGLHEQKPVGSRLFGYLTQVTPDKASLTKLTVDFSQTTMSIGGKAPTLDVVSVYTDTLKATGYKIGPDVQPKSITDVCPNIDGNQLALPDRMILDKDANCVMPPKAFSEVVLSQFGRDDKGATFTITLKYNADIFDDTKQVQIVVPSGLQTNQTNLFEAGI